MVRWIAQLSHSRCPSDSWVTTIPRRMNKDFLSALETEGLTECWQMADNPFLKQAWCWTTSCGQPLNRAAAGSPVCSTTAPPTKGKDMCEWRPDPRVPLHSQVPLGYISPGKKRTRAGMLTLGRVIKPATGYRHRACCVTPPNLYFHTIKLRCATYIQTHATRQWGYFLTLALSGNLDAIRTSQSVVTWARTALKSPWSTFLEDHHLQWKSGIMGKWL